MSSRLRPSVLVFCTAFLLGCGPAPAQNASTKAAPKQGDPYAFSIRVYRIPSDELLNGFVSKERGRLRAPALPPASASHGELEAFLKRDHEVMKEYLAQNGITLPPGSLACYDPVSETLALRAMAVVHTLMDSWSDSILRSSPKQLAWTVNILEAPSAAIRAAMKDGVGSADHAAVYDRLLPQAKLVTTMRGETKSGQRIESNQGPLRHNAVSYAVDEAQRVQYTREETPGGTKFEMDPVIGADGATIDINFSLEHHPLPPVPRWDVVTAGSSPKIEAQHLDQVMAKIQTSITLMSGTTRLLGLWSLEGAADPERAKGASQVAFLRTVIVPLFPLPDPRTEQILKERGEAVVPTPKGVRPVADPTLPPGMSVRRFRIPPDFLSSAGSGGATAAPAADPFASGAAPANEPRFMRAVTAEDILKAYGIPFPEGSSANFLPESSELVVRNLPANLDQVADYVDDLNRTGPKTVGFSLHVVQGDAALIRRLEQECLTLPDHAAAWKAIEDATAQGQAKILNSIWLETKSGQRASSENVVLYETVTEVALSKPAAQPATDDKDAPKAAPPRTHRDLELVQDATPVGLRMEVDPVIGGDGRTVDLNLALDYDYAPPVARAEPNAGPEGTQRLAAPQTEFRRAHFMTATTMLSGSTRLLSVWKPSGAPELDGDILQAVFLRMDIVKVEPPTR